jgi:hypothetical protein
MAAAQTTETIPMTKTMPNKLPIQIIGPTTLRRARDEYTGRWGRPWPESDSYLAELIIDAKDALGLPPRSKAKPNEVREDTLQLMRLDHEF